jgi:beta-lactamase regulating signal transducer with metallopeptidase domain/uncharacterized GH25 family protein
MKTQLAAMLNSAADAWAAWMWPMAWHVAVLVLVVAALNWLLRGRSARLRYALWLLVPIRLLLPPTLALATGWGWWLLPDNGVTEIPARTSMVRILPAQPNASHRSPAARRAQPTSSEQERIGRFELISANLVFGDANLPETDLPAAAPTTKLRRGAIVPIHLRAWLFCGWLLGVTLLGSRLLCGCFCAARMVCRAQDVSLAHDSGHQGADSANDTDSAELLERCRFRIGIGRSVRLCQLTDAGVPMLIGFVQPTIILPTGLDKRLTSQELEAVLAHELQHVARHDPIVRLVQSLLGVLYFFHPLVWLTNRLLNDLREDACDEATVAVLDGKRHHYGAGIVKVAQMMSSPPAAMSLGVVESGGQVKRRLRRILDPRLPVGRRLSWSAIALLLVFAAVMLPVAARPRESASQEPTKPANGMLSILPADAETRAEVAPMHLLAQSVSGRVIGLDGKPVAGAKVVFATNNQEHRFWDHGELEPDNGPVSSDANGAFALPVQSERYTVIVTHDEGYAEVTLGPDGFPHELRLNKWARVEGRVMQAGQPVAGALVGLKRLRLDVSDYPNIDDGLRKTTDEAGRFVFERVPPLKWTVQFLSPRNDFTINSAESVPLDLTPGQRVTLDLGVSDH